LTGGRNDEQKSRVRLVEYLYSENAIIRKKKGEAIGKIIGCWTDEKQNGPESECPGGRNHQKRNQDRTPKEKRGVKTKRGKKEDNNKEVMCKGVRWPGKISLTSSE